MRSIIPGQPSLLTDLPEKKKHKLAKDVEYSICVLPSFVEFCSPVEAKKSTMFQPIRGQAVIFVDVSVKRKPKLDTGLALCQVYQHKFCCCREEVKKMYQQIRRHGAIFVDASSRKKTNFVEDVEYFLPTSFVKICSVFADWKSIMTRATICS